MDENFVSAHDVAMSAGENQLGLAWDDLTRDDYCTTKCMIYDKCHGNHDRCIKKLLANAFCTLTETEEAVLRLRCGFYGGKQFTLTEVAECLGTSGERVRQIEAKALRKLRHPSRRKVWAKMGADICNITSMDNFITEACKYIAPAASE